LLIFPLGEQWHNFTGNQLLAELREKLKSCGLVDQLARNHHDRRDLEEENETQCYRAF